ncbi:hypothetical protein [Pseudomonas sp. MWU13-2100]|uniref:hypothetical protein n=1 Tax=Pseudomonas sp. MWU13-2100 TaxID=2935075 RepID=UPI00200CDC29|nr:hypothetical protein [Pseudomonas sp. MWU13-2100]
MLKIYIYMLLFLAVTYSKIATGTITHGEKPGSIELTDNDRKTIYENITGDKDGFYRSLISINDSPALLVLGRDSYYYTLTSQEGQVLIDCAYFDVRNIYNGARASAGICGLNVQLSEGYDEIAQNYSNVWRSSIFSFGTGPVFEKGLATHFLLGSIGSVDIYDRYPSVESIENASPQKYIKSHAGCFDLGSAVGFLVFLNKDKSRLQYLDILRSVEPMRFQRMRERDLKRLAVNKCV